MDDSRALTKQAVTVLLWLAARGVGCEPADPDAAFAAATPRTQPVAAPPAVRVRGAVEPGPVSEDVAPRPLREDLEGALAERINQARRLGADCGSVGYAEGARGKPLWVLMLGEPVSGALSRSAASD